MTKLDLHWMSNQEWITFTKYGPRLKPDAPSEAQESYQRYVAQNKNTRILQPLNGIHLLGGEENSQSIGTSNKQIILE